MADVLQEIDLSEEVDTIKVSVSYIIRSDESTLKSISKELGIEPTRLWNKDEEYLGKQYNKIAGQFEYVEKKRSYSIWEIDTSVKLTSKRVDEHIEYLVEQLLPRKAVINRLVKDTKYLIRVNIFKKSYSEVIDYNIRPQLLKQLVCLCNDFRFSNYYVPSDEVEVDG